MVPPVALSALLAVMARMQAPGSPAEDQEAGPRQFVKGEPVTDVGPIGVVPQGNHLAVLGGHPDYRHGFQGEDGVIGARQGIDGIPLVGLLGAPEMPGGGQIEGHRGGVFPVAAIAQAPVHPVAPGQGGRKAAQHRPGLAVGRGVDSKGGAIHVFQPRPPGDCEGLGHRLLDLGEIAFQNNLAAGAAAPFGLGKVYQRHGLTSLTCLEYGGEKGTDSPRNYPASARKAQLTS